MGRHQCRYGFVLPGLVVAGLAVGGGSTAGASPPPPGGSLVAFQGPDNHVSNQSSSSSIVSDGHTTRVTVVVNERTCQAEVSGSVVSVNTVTVNSRSYVEITKGEGVKQRVPCD